MATFAHVALVSLETNVKRILMIVDLGFVLMEEHVLMLLMGKSYCRRVRVV